MEQIFIQSCLPIHKRLDSIEKRLSRLELLCTPKEGGTGRGNLDLSRNGPSTSGQSQKGSQNVTTGAIFGERVPVVQSDIVVTHPTPQLPTTQRLSSNNMGNSGGRCMTVGSSLVQEPKQPTNLGLGEGAQDRSNHQLPRLGFPPESVPYVVVLAGVPSLNAGKIEDYRDLKNKCIYWLNRHRPFRRGAPAKFYSLDEQTGLGLGKRI